jgi:hypothetical protein
MRTRGPDKSMGPLTFAHRGSQRFTGIGTQESQLTSIEGF